MGDLISAASLVAEIGVDGEVAAATKLAAFGAKVDETAAKQVAGASRIGGAFHVLDGQLGSFGVPFMGTLGRVGTALERTETAGKSLASSLSSFGRTEAIAAAVGLAAVATESVHLADDLEAAHAREETAIKNVGQSYDEYQGKLATTDTAMEKLGFTHAETESSIAKLLPVTHDTAKAMELEATAADLARGRHADLDTATTALVRTEGGRYTLLGRLLGLSKQQVDSIHNETEAVALITSLYGGQASAYAETFAGKQKILGAELKDMGASLGEVIVPALEQTISVGVGATHVFTDLNTASHGFVGQISLVAAGLPIAVFAFEKLTSGARALGAMFYTTNAAALAQSGTVETLAAAQENEARATLTAVEAEAAFRAALTSDLVTETEVVAATEALAAARTQLAGASEASAGASLASESASAAGGLTALGGAGIALTVVLASAAYGFSKARAEEEKFSAATKQAVTDMFNGGVAAQGAAQVIGGQFSPKVAQLSQDYLNAVIAGKQNVLTVKQLEFAIISIDGPLAALGGRAKELATALHDQSTSMGSAQLQTERLTAAQQVYGDLIASGSHDENALAAARRNVVSASHDAQATQEAVNAATQAGAGNAQANAVEETALAKAYDGVALSASDAASAMSQASGAAFNGLQINIQSHKVSADLSDALDALKGKNKTLGGGGGGGSGSHKSVAEAALDQSQKELTLRDALKAVGDESAAVTSAEHQLAAAKVAEHQAIVDQVAATKTYQAVLHGVAADTLAARNAEEDYQKAQLDRRSAVLDTADAEVALSDARKAAADDQIASAQAVSDAEAQLGSDQAGGADPQTIIDDQKAIADAKKAASTQAASDNEKVQRAEIALAEARLKQKDAVTALNTASRTYHDTLHGFPATSAEAKAAQQALTAANEAATSASDSESSALRGVRDAEDAAATNALALQRASADLRGELDKTGGAGGSAASAGQALQTFQQKLDAAATAAASEATQVGVAIQTATHSVAEGMIAEVNTLQTLVDQQPLLKAALDPAIAALLAQLRHFATVTFINGAPVALDTPLGRAQANATHQHGTQFTGAHAAGGTIGPGEFGIINDAGPEIVEGLAGGGAQIHTHGASLQLLGGGGNGDLLAELRGLRADIRNMKSMVVNANGTDPNAVLRLLDQRDFIDRIHATL